jgi:5-methyltetrahydrofolate--homocysteine methyltransferase
MIVIGELINSSRKKIKTAMENQDAAWIKTMATRQEQAGVDYIDVNAGVFGEEELDKLQWTIEQVQAVCKTPLSIDSPRPDAIKLGLELHANGKPLINSISKETNRWNEMFTPALESEAVVLGLCIDDNGISDQPETRLKIADQIINDFVRAGKKIDDIAIDPITTPIGVNTKFGLTTLDTIERIRGKFPEVKIITGLSNISFGLPARKQLNRAFVVMCMAFGLNGALVNPLDPVMMSIIKAADSLLDHDPYCAEYLKAYRNGLVTN